jgi:hypothetical protein
MGMRRIALAVCVALLVAACGSDKGQGSGTTTEQDPVAAAQRRVSPSRWRGCACSPTPAA